MSDQKHPSNPITEMPLRLQANPDRWEPRPEDLEALAEYEKQATAQQPPQPIPPAFVAHMDRVMARIQEDEASGTRIQWRPFREFARERNAAWAERDPEAAAAHEAEMRRKYPEWFAEESEE